MFHLTENSKHRLKGLKVDDVFTYWKGFCLEDVKRICREHGLIIRYARPRTKLSEQFGSFTCSVIWKASQIPLGRESKVFDLYLMYKTESEKNDIESLPFAYMLEAYCLGVQDCIDRLTSCAERLEREDDSIHQAVAQCFRELEKSIKEM